jgi:putative MATE family efflux protein
MGDGDVERAEMYVSRAASGAFVVAAFVSILLWLSAEPVLRRFGAAGSTLAQAEDYLGWILLASPLQAASTTFVAALSAEGRPKDCFLLQLAGTLVNAVLAPVFIFALDWGVAGAGLAVAISQVAGLVVTLLFVFDAKGVIRPRPRLLFPSPRTVFELARVGAPMALLQLVFCAIFAVANIAVEPYGGELGLAAIGVVVTIVQFLGFPLFGIASGAQPVWGYNYGAGKWRRVSRIGSLTMTWTLVLAILSELAMVAAPTLFVRLFSGDPALARIGAHSLRVFAIAFVLLPIELVPVFYFQATGRSGPVAAIFLLRSLSFIAGMIALPPVLGYDGVLWAEPLSDAVAGALGFGYGLRMRREIRENAAAERLAAMTA